MNIRSFSLFLLLLVLAACGGGSDGGANLQYLDSTFGDRGVSYIDFDGTENIATNLAIQSDGRIVVAGYSRHGVTESFALARLSATGQLDNSFADAGRLVHDIGLGNARARGVAVQNDGKILVTGTLYNGLDTDVLLVRYLGDGRLDTSFGVGGIVAMDIGGDVNTSNAVALQSDGKILVTGESADNLLVVRFNTDGTPDVGFGAAGIALLDVPHSNVYAAAVGKEIVIGQGGEIVVAGEGFELGPTNSPTRTDFFVARVLANGSIDAAFADNGYIIGGSSEADHLAGLVVQPDGKILAAAVSYYIGLGDRMAVYRYQTDGSYDSTFGGDGSYSGSYAPSIADSGALTPADNGSFLSAAYVKSTTDQTFEDVFIEKLTDRGALDTAFAVDGGARVYTQSLERSGSVPQDISPLPVRMAAYPDSKTIIMSSRWNGVNNDFVLARVSLIAQR